MASRNQILRGIKIITGNRKLGVKETKRKSWFLKETHSLVLCMSGSAAQYVCHLIILSRAAGNVVKIKCR